MDKNLENLRKSYHRAGLTEDMITDDPMAMFHNWFQEVLALDDADEPNVMAVATIGTDGFPKNRMVLLKRYDAERFVFYTNYQSEKGRAIDSNNLVCLSFYWPLLERQVIVKGYAEKSTPKESDEYFQSRPKRSQLGVLASHQSRVIPSREILDRAMSELETAFEDKKVPRPDYWGGYNVFPESIEFWQGRESRLHDRIRYRKTERGSWAVERLSP